MQNKRIYESSQADAKWQDIEEDRMVNQPRNVRTLNERVEVKGNKRPNDDRLEKGEKLDQKGLGSIAASQLAPHFLDHALVIIQVIPNVLVAVSRGESCKAQRILIGR